MPDAFDPSRLAALGQGHLAEHASGLSQPERERFFAELAGLDLEAIPDLVRTVVLNPIPEKAPASIEPAPVVGLNDPTRSPARHTGEALIRAGKVACFTVAGGQGSRLGYEGPKGCYPTSCVTNKPLFQIFAESILGSQRRHEAEIPWYIMTSPLNHEQTVAFFNEHAHFGLDPALVRFFPQGVMPSFDLSTGNILLSERGHAATNPDGHGGAFRALQLSGAVDDMRQRGIEHLSYFQVDNPHARAIDPVFLGLHASSPDSSGQFSSKVVAKASWDEKVGVFCRADDRTRVIEYSDLPEALARETDANGTLRYFAGSIAIHAIGVRFIELINSDAAFALPFHRAVKKVPFYDPGTGSMVQPDAPNAVKLEKFVFDAIPLASKSIVVETDRVEEFAPVKNATGVDSIVSSKRIQSERAGRWLEACGVKIPRTDAGEVDATIEISPLTAQDIDELREADLPDAIDPGATVVL